MPIASYRGLARSRVHEDYLIHRSVMFFIFDDEEQVFVNQRSASKEMYPGYWSIAFGGHVLAGETYDDAVVRELLEETGLNDPPFLIRSFQKRTRGRTRERSGLRSSGYQRAGAIRGGDRTG